MNDDEIVVEEKDIEIEKDDVIDDEMVKPAKVIETKEKKSVNETVNEIKERIKSNIVNQRDDKAKLVGYIGGILGAVVIVCLLLNFFTLAQFAGLNFGRTLLYLLPQLLMTIVGAMFCYFNKLYLTDKYIKYGFWLNIVAFISLWLTIVWGVIIF